MNWNPETIKKLRDDISFRLPDSLVMPRHTITEHFYEILIEEEDKIRRTVFISPKRLFPLNTPNPIYPSVTGKLQILKDESLINFKMNRAIESMGNYMFNNFKLFNDSNIMEHISISKEAAIRAPASIVEDAGDIGTRIHGYREKYFKDWITTGKRPLDILSYIPSVEEDIRSISALRALNKFLDDTGYVPIACELLVYDHGMKVAGTLDDIGLIHRIIRSGTPGCTHELIEDSKGITRCLKCPYKRRYELALMDLKTSNRFKDHYFFQVSLYYKMFKSLTGYTPERSFILKVSKEDGTYKIEDLYKPSKIASYAKSMVRTFEGINSIKELRSDNQKIVIKVL